MSTKTRRIEFRKTHALIIDDCDLLYASIPAELIIQVSLCATDAEAKNAENTRGVRGLRWRKKMWVTGHEKKEIQHTIWPERLCRGGCDGLRVLERERLGEGSFSLTGSAV